ENSTSDAARACFPIDNNSTVRDAILTIEGGTVTGRGAIRMFANSTVNENEVIITGGTVRGTSYALWMQNPGSKDPKALLNISGSATTGKILLSPSAKFSATISGGYVSEVAYWEPDASNPQRNVTGFVSGGTFAVPVLEEYCATGYIPADNGDGTYGVKLGKYVARNTTTGVGYETLAAAIAAAQAGDTVTLLDDIAIDTETMTIESGMSVTLDMNDKKITVSDNKAADNYELFYIYGELTVTGNGTIELTAATDRNWDKLSAIFHNRGGVLTIENGTYKHLGGTDMAYVVDNSGNYHGEATTNIMGGELKSTYTAIRNRMEQNSHGASGTAILNISGGTIDGTTSAIWAQAASANESSPATGEINISGGNIGVINTARSTGAVCETRISGGSVASVKCEVNELWVTGGTVNGFNILSAAGAPVDYAVTAEGQYVSAVAKIGATNYATLAVAIAAAQAGDTVTLLDDIELTETVKILKDDVITLDLNGKTIDGTEKVRIALMSYGSLTIKDSSSEQTGVIKAGVGTGGNAINVCGGTFTLESGSIYSKNNAILIDEEAAVVTINGGKITAELETNNSAVFYISSTSATELNIYGGEMVGYNGILLWNNTTINMTGGSIEAKGRLGIQGNGSRDNTEINISGDAVITAETAAIYHPQGGKLNISGNAKLTGDSGVIVKGGSVTVSGGTISGVGEAKPYQPVSSGFEVTGDGLYVEHYDNSTNSGNYGTPTVIVTGGTFTSENAKAVASYANPNNAVEALTGFLTGGTYNTAVPEEYCAEGYIPVKNSDGTYGVKLGKYVARNTTTGVGYETLAAAIDAAQAGDTVTLIDDIELTEGIVVAADKDFTLDLNGNVLSGVTTAAASSAVITNNGT
ncbi:MAG: hypothetical protein IKK34_11295, partial [Clostridia bacterium]|nr:hypothetical protein [Clostridia bacterium]